MIIAIDGPSGAGKSTVAKAVAQELGFSCLDTGAMYRAVAWKALDDGTSIEDEQEIAHIAQSNEISFGHDDGDPVPKRVFIADQEVTDEIRTARIDKCVSAVSAVAAVRRAMVDQQRRIGSQGNYVIEGRDIGTEVFPGAEVKIFLTASAEERAHRRVLQNEERGIGSLDYDEVLADIVRRDELDSSRDTSPLRPAEDAVLLDSTDKSIEQIIAAICDEARARM